jgi:hypothetical protein
VSDLVSLNRPAHRATPWPDAITVVAWHDPVIEQASGAIATTSDEFLIWWGNTLGPTALLVARHLALYATEGESEWPLDQLAGTYGVSVATIGRTLDRLARFVIVARHGSTIAVRLIAGPLSQRQVDRLPRYLAEAREP